MLLTFSWHWPQLSYQLLLFQRPQFSNYFFKNCPLSIITFPLFCINDRLCFLHSFKRFHLCDLLLCISLYHFSRSTLLECSIPVWRSLSLLFCSYILLTKSSFLAAKWLFIFSSYNLIFSPAFIHLFLQQFL